MAPSARSTVLSWGRGAHATPAAPSVRACSPSQCPAPITLVAKQLCKTNASSKVGDQHSDQATSCDDEQSMLAATCQLAPSSMNPLDGIYCHDDMLTCISRWRGQGRGWR